jgi:hypothetical protein
LFHDILLNRISYPLIHRNSEILFKVKSIGHRGNLWHGHVHCEYRVRCKNNDWLH